jgi:hypothetical protein
MHTKPEREALSQLKESKTSMGAKDEEKIKKAGHELWEELLGPVPGRPWSHAKQVFK